MVYLAIIFIPTLYLYTLLWRLRKEISGKEALTLSQYKPKFLPLIKCPNLIIKLHLNYKKTCFWWYETSYFHECTQQVAINKSKQQTIANIAQTYEFWQLFKIFHWKSHMKWHWISMYFRTYNINISKSNSKVLS